MGMNMGTLFNFTGTVDIVGLIVCTWIGNCFGTGIVSSGVGVVSGVGVTGGACGVASCRILAMDSTALVLVPP